MRSVLGILVLALALAGCSAPPEIPQAAIDHAYDVMAGYQGVRETLVTVKDGRVQLVIVTDPSITPQYARQLGDNFARALASGAAIHRPKDFKTPAKDYLGGLYEKYDLEVVVAWSADNIIAQAVKTKGANNSLRWY